jgi:hypothetical protein
MNVCFDLNKKSLIVFIFCSSAAAVAAAQVAVTVVVVVAIVVRGFPSFRNAFEHTLYVVVGQRWSFYYYYYLFICDGF